MNAPIMTVLLLLPLLFIIGCENSTNLDPVPDPDPDPGYELGDFQLRDTGPAGGLIFYIDEADEFDWTFLEAAPQSTEWTKKEWGDFETEIGGNAGLTGVGDGRAATDAVVAHMNGKGITGTAAQLCDALSHNGFDDWFLPSRLELNQVYVNLHAHNVGGFATHLYWSSSEHNDKNAWYLYFSGGTHYNDFKVSDLRVRAVRAF